jgi:Xaa-Pro aminopeptidase
MNFSAADKLSAIRSQLQKLGVDGLILPHADEYQSEYLPASAERLAWLTGFTGSAGAAAVLPDRAAAFTDGRYLIQIRNQVDPHLFEIVDITKANPGDWLSLYGKKGQVIGYDPKLYTPKQIRILQDKISDRGLSLKAIENPVDAVWTDRPADPVQPAEIFPDSIAGRSSAEKRAMLAAELRERGLASAVITQPDSIAWLLNIRGQDVPHNPLVLSYAILHEDGSVDWFADARKITPDIKAHLGNAVGVRDPGTIGAVLKDLKGPVLLDHQRSPQWFLNQLKAAGVAVKDGKDPCILPKACKTEAEQEGMRAAHLRDGIAVTKFLCWLDKNGKDGWTERDIEKKLNGFRREQPGYRAESFDTIAGWAGHGAIIHYRATAESNAKIIPPGILLLDSGAQYNDGTTDITRTIAIGEPGADMKDRFTRVLKGHIGVACAIFPEGTPGAQIDTLARKPLWDAGLEYAHGTGHGVGCYLCVHEEAASISPRGHDPIKAGMVLSNEPGFYKEGEFGIRIENLVLCQGVGVTSSEGRPMLDFETLTLAPIDRNLIEVRLLTDDERDWLNVYHDRVYESLAAFMDPDERDWLRKATEKI